VHVFGRPCQIDRLSELAERHGLSLILDAAQAVGCTYRGSPIGGFGVAEVFSFHATKYLNSFEGGAIVTNDDELAERARAMRNLGMNDEREQVVGGINGRMTEASAAMGLTSLEAMSTIISTNRRNHRLYRSGLAGIGGVRLREMAPGEQANYQYVVIEVDGGVAGADRDTVLHALAEQNVLARPYFHPACHQIPPYADNPAVYTPLPLPRTEALSDRVLSLPTGMAIGAAEISAICEIIRAVCAGGQARAA